MHFGVTGGAGFIGSNLVRLLIGKGHQVTVLDDFSTGLESNLYGLDVEVLDGSLLDFNRVMSFAENLDYIYHLGARGSVPRSIENPRATFQVNTEGTFNVLEAARFRSVPVLFSSSSSVYGDNTLLPKSESQRVSPVTPYAASKASAENFAYAYAKSYNMDVSIIRFFNVFGPYQRPDHLYAAVIPKWIWAALRGEDLVVFGDGETSRDFTFIDTLTTALYEIANKKLHRNLPINFAFGKPVSLNHILKEIKRLFPNIHIRYEGERKGDIRYSANDPQVVRGIFPHLKEIDFREGLERTTKWLKEKYQFEERI